MMENGTQCVWFGLLFVVYKASDNIFSAAETSGLLLKKAFCLKYCTNQRRFFGLILVQYTIEFQIGDRVLQRRKCWPNFFLCSCWQLELSSQGKFVVLEVDGSNGLVVGMQSQEPEEVLSGELRLALGGVLIDKDKMIVQVGLFSSQGSVKMSN